MRMGRWVVAACLFVILISITSTSTSTSAARNLRPDHVNATDLQNLLNRLNKPPVKSIQSPDGDVIDCISINKQPAFDHPLLKNHVIQMRPSYEPSGRSEESKTVSQLWQSTNQTCPDGTVPIRRIKEEDLLRAHSLEDYGKKPYTPGKTHEYATVDVGAGNYYGARAIINVWKPEVEKADEFSLSQLWLTSGTYQQNNLNTIETGWQAYPEFYGDGNPRFFIYWTKDAYQSGCYNVACGGFVQVSTKVAVGATLAPVSVYGGSNYEIIINVWKDEGGKKWWVKLGDEVVGYWPLELFTSLANFGDEIMFGGEIMNLGQKGHSATDMGSGHFPGEGVTKASYFKNIQTVDSNNVLHDPVSLHPLISNPNCYDINTASNSVLGTYFFYGGPGQNPKCP